MKIKINWVMHNMNFILLQNIEKKNSIVLILLITNEITA